MSTESKGDVSAENSGNESDLSDDEAEKTDDEEMQMDSKKVCLNFVVTVRFCEFYIIACLAGKWRCDTGLYYIRK